MCFWGVWGSNKSPLGEWRDPCSPPATEQKCHSFSAAAFCHSSQKRAEPENCNSGLLCQQSGAISQGWPQHRYHTTANTFLSLSHLIQCIFTSVLFSDKLNVGRTLFTGVPNNSGFLTRTPPSFSGKSTSKGQHTLMSHVPGATLLASHTLAMEATSS